MKDSTDHLKQLGAKETDYAQNVDKGILETFENKFTKRPYTIEFETNEFTSLCPKTGQPDFAHIVIRYTPTSKCIESKSLKLYLFSYRSEGSFMETITNRILADLVECCSPHYMYIEAKFNARGGITTVVEVDYNRDSGFESKVASEKTS